MKFFLNLFLLTSFYLGGSFSCWSMTYSPPFQETSSSDTGLRLSIKVTENDQGLRFYLEWPSHQHIKDGHLVWKQQGKRLSPLAWKQQGPLRSVWLEERQQMTFQSPSVWLLSEHPLSIEWMAQGCSDQGFCYFPQAFRLERSSIGSSWTMRPIPFSN